MKIYMIRHGETDWNTVKRLQGSVDIPLNENGRELARITSEAMKDIAFDIIFTSPLERARETAKIIKGDRDIPVIIDDRIKEMCFGRYEGCIAKENPDIWILFKQPAEYVAPEDGETLETLCERCKCFLEEKINDPELADKTILISSHGAATKALLRAIKKVPLSEFWGGGVQKNCSVTIVEVKDKTLHIIEEAKTFY